MLTFLVGILILVLGYFFWASSGHLTGVPFGIGMPLELSYVVSLVLTVVIYVLAIRQGKKLKADKTFSADEE